MSQPPFSFPYGNDATRARSPQARHGKQQAEATQGARLTNCFTSWSRGLLRWTGSERWVPAPTSRSGAVAVGETEPPQILKCAHSGLSWQPDAWHLLRLSFARRRATSPPGKKQNCGGELRPEPVGGCRTAQRAFRFAAHFRAMPRMSEVQKAELEMPGEPRQPFTLSFRHLKNRNITPWH